MTQPSFSLRKPDGFGAPVLAVTLTGLAVVLSTAMVNIGVVAMDDYSEVIARIIPAGTVSFPELIAKSATRSPVPVLFLSVLARLAEGLGISSPAGQLRFILSLIGGGSFLAIAYSASLVFRKCGEQRGRLATGILLVGIYFASPFALTRPMFESLCVPYLALSVGFACRYWAEGKTWTLLVALFFLTVASVFRFQAGVCVAALLALPLFRRRLADLIPLGILAVVAFFATGALDGWLRGEFHASIKQYIQYNVQHSSSHGTTPFYTFALLFFGLSFPPLLLSRYRSFDWRREYRPLLPLALYFIVFVLAHSFVPHKEERFMIPVFPLFLLLLAPVAYYFYSEGQRWRIALFLALNTPLLILTSYNIAQNNVVALGIFLDKHPEIATVRSVDSTLTLIPFAFVGRELSWEKFDSKSAPWANASPCDTVLVCRADLAPQAIEDRYTQVKSFEPGLLEAILIRLNPRQNLRRSAIGLYLSKECAQGR